MKITVVSFGFKNGPPVGADLTVDARLLQNPYRVKKLRELTGLSEQVSDYIMKDPHWDQFKARTRKQAEVVIDDAIRRDKGFVTIGVGCYGGQHRSVSVAILLADWIRYIPLPSQTEIKISHRDLRNG